MGTLPTSVRIKPFPLLGARLAAITPEAKGFRLLVSSRR